MTIHDSGQSRQEQSSPTLRERFEAAVAEAASGIASTYLLRAKIATHIADVLSPLMDEAERAVEIMDKLPRTADGVPVVPGMTIHRVARPFYEVEAITDGGMAVEGHQGSPDIEYVDIADFYSTREAALAAQEGGETR